MYNRLCYSYVCHRFAKTRGSACLYVFQQHRAYFQSLQVRLVVSLYNINILGYSPYYGICLRPDVCLRPYINIKKEQ